MILSSKVALSRQPYLRRTEIIFDTLVSLGFMLKILKCYLMPSTRIKHFGFYIDSIKITVELSQDKIDTITGLATDIYHPQVQLLFVYFQNLSVTSFPTVQLGPLFYRSLEKDKIHGLKETNFSYDAKTILSDQSKQDLLWRIKCVHVNCSKPIKPRILSALLFSDASDEGVWSTRDKSFRRLSTGFHTRYIQFCKSVAWLAMINLQEPWFDHLTASAQP